MCGDDDIQYHVLNLRWKSIFLFLRAATSQAHPFEWCKQLVGDFSIEISWKRLHQSLVRVPGAAPVTWYQLMRTFPCHIPSHYHVSTFSDPFFLGQDSIREVYSELYPVYTNKFVFVRLHLVLHLLVRIEHHCFFTPTNSSKHDRQGGGKRQFGQLDQLFQPFCGWNCLHFGRVRHAFRKKKVAKRIPKLSMWHTSMDPVTSW